jgi:hypothetical protein
LPHLSSVKLNALPAIYSSIDRAPIGTLIQCRARNDRASEPIVGLRCEVHDPRYTKPVPGLVPLEGKSRGVFLAQPSLDVPGAMDVSGLLTISVANPAPQPAHSDHRVGNLYIDTGSLAIYAWSQLLDDHAWLCVLDPSNTTPPGQFVRSLDLMLLVELGEPLLLSVEGFWPEPEP